MYVRVCGHILHHKKLLFSHVVTCSLPAPPTNGFVAQISNSIVLFGCNEGFSPQENKTAHCVASDQWRPSAAEILCSAVDSIQQGKCLPTYLALIKKCKVNCTFDMLLVV